MAFTQPRIRFLISISLSAAFTLLILGGVLIASLFPNAHSPRPTENTAMTLISKDDMALLERIEFKNAQGEQILNRSLPNGTWNWQGPEHSVINANSDTLQAILSAFIDMKILNRVPTDKDYAERYSMDHPAALITAHIKGKAPVVIRVGLLNSVDNTMAVSSSTSDSIILAPLPSIAMATLGADDFIERRIFSCTPDSLTGLRFSQVGRSWLFVRDNEGWKVDNGPRLDPSKVQRLLSELCSFKHALPTIRDDELKKLATGTPVLTVTIETPNGKKAVAITGPVSLIQGHYIAKALQEERLYVLNKLNMELLKTSADELSGAEAKRLSY